MHFTTHTKLFLSHFLAIVLVSGSIGTYFYSSAVDNLMRSLQSRLLNSASMLSNVFSAAELGNLNSAEDVDTPAYQQLRARIQEFASANADLAFVYIMRKQGDRAAFVVDSDPVAPATPGEIYNTHIPELMAGFLRPSVDSQITRDKWGSFLSGYAPLQGDPGQYLIGIDMFADEVDMKLLQLKQAGMISLAVSLLLATVFSSVLSRHFIRRIQSLTLRCEEIARTQLDTRTDGLRGDELDHLAHTIESMASHLELSQVENETARLALQQSKDELEDRVQQRTEELLNTNDMLREEIQERERIEAILQQTALTDFLTQLPNRRAMIKRLDSEVARFERSGRPFSLVLLDIDHFKAVNDTCGHDAGDAILISFAETMLGWVRENDVLARWGGEEFLILLCDTNVHSASEQAERLRSAIEKYSFGEHTRSTHITASLGVAGYNKDESMDACIKNADIALYRAKTGGRNRVVTQTST
jgi:diguanylate cyclase (GGDEF)-like protein